VTVIRGFTLEYIDLDAGVVMPDHVHLILRPLKNEKLGRVLHLIKGRSARQVNRLLTRRGLLVMDESFDHIIRNDVVEENKIVYINQNPVKNGLVTQSLEYQWLLVHSLDGRHTG